MSNWGEEPLDIYERAFGIIANASNGDWSKESEEWQEAAAEFRKDYHHALDKHSWETERELLEQEINELQLELREARTVRKATPTECICFEIERERKRQDEKWGGPDHDDTHCFADWRRFRNLREEYLEMQTHLQYKDTDYMRKLLIRIAALTVAQIESFDRELNKKSGM
jgi:hypothetical protein